MKKLLGCVLCVMLLFFGASSTGAETIVRYHSVPEPTTMLLIGTGLICLGVFGRKKVVK